MKKHMPVPENLVADSDMKTAIDTRGLSIRTAFPKTMTDDYVRNELKRSAAHDPFLPDPDDPFRPQPIAPERQPLFKRGRDGEGVIPELLTGADEEIKRVLREHGVPDQDEIDQSKPSQVFVRVNGESIPAEVFRSGDVWMCRANGKKYVGESRDQAMVRCCQGLKQEARSLSDTERLEIARLAASGSNPGNEYSLLLAIGKYVKGMTGVELTQAYVDPAHLPIVNEAVKFCWEQASPGFAPGPDWDEFLTSYAQGRPYSLAIVASAAQSYLKQRDDKAFDKTLNGSAREWMEELRPAPPTPADFEDMDDAEIGNLMRSVGRERARGL